MELLNDKIEKDKDGREYVLIKCFKNEATYNNAIYNKFIKVRDSDDLPDDQIDSYAKRTRDDFWLPLHNKFNPA